MVQTGSGVTSLIIERGSERENFSAFSESFLYPWNLISATSKSQIQRIQAATKILSHLKARKILGKAFLPLADCIGNRLRIINNVYRKRHVAEVATAEMYKYSINEREMEFDYRVATWDVESAKNYGLVCPGTGKAAHINRGY